MSEVHVSNQREFQLWAYELLEDTCDGYGLDLDHIYYPGIPEPDSQDIPQNNLHVRIWVRPNPNSNQAYTMGARDQKRRMVNTGRIFIKVNYPAGTPSLLTSSWELVILLQKAFQRRDHPCGIQMPSVVVDEVGKLEGDPYYQLLLTAHYEFDEFI